MVKTKGGRDINPADAFRKEQRKKEIQRNKMERKFIREGAKLRSDPMSLKEQLQEIIDMEDAGTLPKNLKLKKKALQEAYDQAIKRKKEEELRAKVGGPQLAAPGAAAGPVMLRPQDSPYYHPTLNPTGAPPPGKGVAPTIKAAPAGPAIPVPKPPPLPAGPKPNLPPPPAAPPLPKGPSHEVLPPPDEAPPPVLPPPDTPPPGFKLPPPSMPPPPMMAMAGRLPPPSGPPPMASTSGMEGGRPASHAQQPQPPAPGTEEDGPPGVGPGPGSSTSAPPAAPAAGAAAAEPAPPGTAPPGPPPLPPPSGAPPGPPPGMPPGPPGPPHPPMGGPMGPPPPPHMMPPPPHGMPPPGPPGMPPPGGMMMAPPGMGMPPPMYHAPPMHHALPPQQQQQQPAHPAQYSAAATAVPLPKKDTAAATISVASTVPKRPPAHQDKNLLSLVPASLRVRRDTDEPKPKRPALAGAKADSGFGLAPKPAAAAKPGAGEAPTSVDAKYLEFLSSVAELGAFDG